jgi:CRISPR system Cascade subunit CasE
MAEHGFDLQHVLVTREQPIDGKRAREVINVYRSEGVLSIRDETLARSAIVSGIGRGKMYGCGFLSLANVA